MNIKKKLTSMLMMIAIMLSFGQEIVVQAQGATSNATTALTSVGVTNSLEANITSGDSTAASNSKNTDVTKVESINLSPNPGISETKPNPLKVMEDYDSQNINNAQNASININSNIGWKNENGYWYYYNSDNIKATGWIKPDANWYYLYSNGQMATGWLKAVSGTWYYLDKSGALAKGWRQINNLWYFFKSSGDMITDINVIDKETYLFNNSGAMVKGWVQLNNYWYYFNNGGNMARGWIFNNNTWYYLYDSGAMAKGWINLNQIWYYLKANGAMATGWISSGSDYYYLDLSSGRLRTNTIAGGYEIGPDGKRLAAVSKFKGIDISHYNGNINFAKVKAAGIQVVYIKATEGTTYVDNYLSTNYNGAKSAGLKTGFYHFLVGTSSPETQARSFYNNIKDKQSDLKPILDVEISDFNVMDYTLRFIAEFNKLSDMEIGIYTYSSFIPNLDNRLASYSLWEANYYKSTDNLPTNKIWPSRAGHQYTDKGVIDGINGDVDLNEFTQDIFR